MSKLKIDYNATMRDQSDSTQDRVVQFINLAIEQDEQPRYQPTTEQLKSAKKGLADIEAGRVLTDEQATTFWKKHDCL